MGKGEGLGETQPHIQPRRVGGPPGVRGQEHQHLPEPLLPRDPPSSDGPTCPLDQQGDAAGALESSPSPSPQTTNQPTGLALSPSHPWPGPTPQSSSGQDAGGRAGATPGSLLPGVPAPGPHAQLRDLLRMAPTSTTAGPAPAKHPSRVSTCPQETPRAPT